MSEINNLDSSFRVLLCGQGRVGKQLIARLSQNRVQLSFCRIDQHKGLYELTSTNQTFDLLIICISASGQSWAWSNILSGLVNQINLKQIEIKQIVLVSSTRVYEGINQGLVFADTPVEPCSIKADAIIAGEQMLFNSESQVWILRCAGIYGPDYPFYNSLLQKNDAKPRAGVTTAFIAERLCSIIEIYRTTGPQSAIEVLTDGKIYFKGVSFLADAQNLPEGVSTNGRVLLSSLHQTKTYKS